MLARLLLIATKDGQVPPARQGPLQSPQRLQAAPAGGSSAAQGRYPAQTPSCLPVAGHFEPCPALQVRDFVFSPDSGRIGALRFDALGLPSLPDAFLTCKEVGMQDVQEVSGPECWQAGCAQVRSLWVSSIQDVQESGSVEVGHAADLPR